MGTEQYKVLPKSLLDKRQNVWEFEKYVYSLLSMRLPMRVYSLKVLRAKSAHS